MKQRKQWLFMIAVLVCVGMLAGCGEKQKTEVVPTPTVAATKAPTETIAPTTEPTATAVPTVEPTVTNTPVPTATNTPAPIATNTPVPTVTPTMVPVNVEGPISGLTAFEITSSMIVGWNLGNTLDSTGSHITYDTAPAKSVMAWGNDEPTKELFEAVKEGGFNTVRIPTTWYQHIKYDAAKDMYVINPDWLAYVKQTVDYAYELNMFVILNCHHEDWANAPKFDEAAYEKASKMLKDIWSQVAELFADYDQHLIFEGMNEPRQTGLGGSVEWGGGDSKSWQYINNLNQVFVDTVRGQGSNANTERLLMLPGYAASSNIATVKSIEVPENSGNVALSVHAYYPYYFAMATDNYANHSFPGKSGYGENYESSINNLFRDLKKISADKNVPIIIGEFGASDFNNTEDRARWATHFLTKAKDAGIPCVFWDNNASYNGTGEAYGLIYRKTLTWYENSIPMLNAVMAVYGQESSLPPYVEYVQPAFDWADVPVEKDWVEIYRAEEGFAIDTWGNLLLENWQPYINEEYDIVMVYRSDAEPYMVLQGGWNKVFTSEVSNNPYMIRFTFADVEKTMTAENVKLSDMYNYFASASSQPMTLYGVFAVPKNAGAGEVSDLPQLLNLSQTYSARYEWQEDIWMLYSKYSNITMWEGAKQYPEMDRVLSERAGMQTRSMEDEADNILSFAQDMLNTNSENFGTQVSTLDEQVRRADSVVLSLLTDSYADYGFIDGFRGVWGSNYDVQTGKELLLSDVILDMKAIPGIVGKELNDHIWAGDFYSETDVADYFKNTPEDGISWTLDYNGVTIYFGTDDFTEQGICGKAATISFAEYPEMFNEKYMKVPEAYMVRLPLDYSFFTDLDADGTLEELNCTGYYNETDRFYTKFGIYTDTNGCYNYEDLFAYDFQPYYVKTEDGKHYIYLFCAEDEVGNQVLSRMLLVVYNIKDGTLTRVGDMNMAPAYIPSDIYVLPLDPNNMFLDNFDSLAQDAEYYMVGKDGMPVKK